MKELKKKSIRHFYYYLPINPQPSRTEVINAVIERIIQLDDHEVINYILSLLQAEKLHPEIMNMWGDDSIQYFANKGFYRRYDLGIRYCYAYNDLTLCESFAKFFKYIIKAVWG